MRHKEFMNTGKIFASFKFQCMLYRECHIICLPYFFCGLYSNKTKDFMQILSDIYSTFSYPVARSSDQGCVTGRGV